MKILLQRVSEATVDVEKIRIAEIASGLLCFICFSPGDENLDFGKVISKIISLRLFRQDDKHFDQSLNSISGELLVISQFTLAADLSKGLRPGFTGSLAPDLAKKLYDVFAGECKKSLGDSVKFGEFGADMNISLVNSGPATFILDF